MPLIAAPTAGAVITTDHGIDFVTVGSPRNAGYSGPDPMFGRVTGRGAVGYEYRIGRLEITTAQWMEFVNTFSVRGGSYTWFATPAFWGADPDPSYSGPGLKWRIRNVANADVMPVAGISWRESAMYCNWLHNGKGTEEWTIQDGAYDTSTFYVRPNGTLADQTTHNPEARFWIPTWDEWLKAAHYDPDRNGPGEGGWWMYSNSSDEEPTPGVPGVGTTNAQFTLPDFGEWSIPLGSYPETLTPWGLLDATGGTTEWTEEWWFPNSTPSERIAEGSWAGDSHAVYESIEWAQTWSPQNGYLAAGFRIATSVPAVPTMFLLVLAGAGIAHRSKVTRYE